MLNAAAYANYPGLTSSDPEERRQALSEFYRDNAQAGTNYSAANLPTVTEPDATMASIAKGQYERYVRNFRDFEKSLLGTRNSKALIRDAARGARQQNKIAREIDRRNASRVGLDRTRVERIEANRALQRGGQLNYTGAVNNARLAQRDANQSLLGDLINIGQGINRSSLSNLGTAAENAAARRAAYTSAKAQSKAQTYNMIGTIGSTALAAAFLI